MEELTCRSKTVTESSTMSATSAALKMPAIVRGFLADTVIPST